MNDLVAFLRARLDEDEQMARAATGGRWRAAHPLVEALGYVPDVVSCSFDGGGTDATETAEHIARWDPARVLAEVAAKRVILDEHEDREVASLDRATWGQMTLVCRRCRVGDRQVVYPCPTVRAVALPYADHPECHPSWLPSVPDRT